MKRTATSRTAGISEKGAVRLEAELGVLLVVAAPELGVIVENGSSSFVVELLAAA